MLRYVVRFFKDEKYQYSVHCDEDSLPELVQCAKDSGRNVKVIAYKDENVQESED